MTATGTASAAAEQVLREALDAKRSQEREQAWTTRAKVGKLSRLQYGKQLISENGNALRVALRDLVDKWFNELEVAGRHYSGLRLLLWFAPTGLDPVVARAMRVTVDALMAGRTYDVLSATIGSSLQAEARAATVKGRDRDLPALIAGLRGKKHVLKPRTLKALKLQPAEWTRGERVEIGGLILDLILEHCDLVELVHDGKRLVVKPLPHIADRLRSLGPEDVKPRRRAMVSPPRPWTGMCTGGLLSGDSPLVVGRRRMEIDEVGLGLDAVNYLQQQQLWVDEDVLDVEIEAWECWAKGGAERLFGVENAGARAKANVFERLQEAHQVRGRPIWFAYEMDWRGRIYTQNRVTTHQGPDSEKALVRLGEEAVTAEGIKWLRRCLASHWSKGLAHGTWEGRESWEPSPEWEKAEDPFQYLQLLTAWRNARDGRPTGAPCRIDQTCSGVGVIAALMRDAEVARLTNLIGDTRADIYQAVADELVEELQMEMETGQRKTQRGYAMEWIPLVSRSLVKKPVMGLCYGARWQSIYNHVEAVRRDAVGAEDMRDTELMERVIWPSRFMTRVLLKVVKRKLWAVMELSEWLGEAVRTVISAGKRFRWVAPAGMQMELEGTYDSGVWVSTVLDGRDRLRTVTWEEEVETSAEKARIGAMANLIHSIDAAICQAIVCSCAERGIPVLTTHDCFATHPNRAGELQQVCLEVQGRLLGVDLLEDLKAQVEQGSGLKLDPLPKRGWLEPSWIGQNTYLYS